MRFHPIRCAYWLTLVALTTHALAAPDSGPVAQDAPTTYRFDAERIVAVGDVHGAYRPLVKVLQANGLIDAATHWSGGTTHLVSLGDLLDRGPRSRDVMDLLRKLQGQAAEAGGRVHVVLGNHEVLNLLGDLRDVSDAEFAAFAPDLARTSEAAAATDPAVARPPGYEELRSALSPTGDYGAWLLSLPAMVQINDTVFVHGGLSPALGALSLASINAEAKAQLEQAFANQGLPPAERQVTPMTLLGDSGPFWYRGTAACHPLLEDRVLTQQLARLGATRVVVGHTPTATRKPRVRLDGRVFAIDTGMLLEVYRGEPYLLELTVTGARVLDARGMASPPPWWHPILLRPPANESLLAEQILTGDAVSGQWTNAGKKVVAKALARWRLDRALGVWVTPLTVAAADNKRFFEAVKGTWITERERREQGRSTPNYCVQGHQNLLIAAFDALLGITTRNQDSLLVHRPTGVVRLEFIKQSFGTSKVLPTYAAQPSLPPAFARKLAALTNDSLTDLLGDLLSERQIKAILKRRDKILQWPTTELQL